MGRITDILFARRDAAPSPSSMIGFTPDGGLVPFGVTGTSSLGLSAVWRCLDILSNAISQLEWSERLGNLELPSSDLVSRPQAERTRREWTGLVVRILALNDVCYLLKVGQDENGKPLALWPLDPSVVMPVTQDYITYLPPKTFWIGGTDKGSVEVARDRLVILHRSPTPGIQDGHGGVLSLARSTFAAAMAAENYASRYWQSGGSPTTVLESDAAIPDAIATQISDRWRERRSRGPDYAPVLSGGLKARDMGVDPTTASAVEARRELVADIGRYFGIPTKILNAPTGDSETYRNSESSLHELLRFTLQNYIDAIQDAITEQLPGGRHMVMETEKLTRASQLAQAQALQLATGNKPWMTQDEARELFGLPPIENAADIQAAQAPATAGVPPNG